MSNRKSSGKKGVVNDPQEDADDNIHDADRVMDGSEDDDDERLDDDAEDLQAGREEDSRELDSRESTDDDMIEAFKRSMFQSALPSLPDLPGFHVCWLTTSNPRDPVVGRLRIGYQLLKVSEVPGMESVEIKQGDYQGYIGVNEMLAAKLPLRLYGAYMNEAHHVAPQQEEDKLKAMTEVIAEQAREASGKKPKIGDGTRALGKGPTKGRFEEIHPIRRGPVRTANQG